MVQSGDLLDDVGIEFARRFGDSVRMERAGDVLSITCENGASVGVSIDDPNVPSFAISYPCFDADAMSWRDVRDRVSRGVLLVAVLGLAAAVEQHGAVLPEFPTSSLRKSIRRGRLGRP